MPTARRATAGKRLAAAGSLAALIAAATATTAAAAPRSQAASRAGEVITCASVDTGSLPQVLGTQCDTSAWGPLSNFTIRDGSGKAFTCAAGWAEGGLWVQGQECRGAS